MAFEDRDIPLNGVILLSAVIDSNASAGEPRQLVALPTEIMKAHYHKKLAPELQKLTVEQIAKQARDFAYVSGNAPPWSGEYNTVVNRENGFAKNPHMKLFVGMGYYDFACPFYPVVGTLTHMKVSEETKKNNISTGYYESGHMVNIDQPSAAKYHADLEKFVASSLPN
jgi:carboxypeptidase C (cathepsin A)